MSTRTLWVRRRSWARAHQRASLSFGRGGLILSDVGTHRDLVDAVFELDRLESNEAADIHQFLLLLGLTISHS